jgi:hypothetical protein
MAGTSESSVSCTERNTKEARNNDIDIEKHAVAEAHLRNTTVHNITWKGVTVTVKDRETKLPKTIVDNVEGIVEAGPSPPPFTPTSSSSPPPTN